MLLGVNIDHIAVLREARKINDPNPLDAVPICKLAGANQITIHLREDRRHIHDNDAKVIIEQSALPVNLECSINEEIINIVCNLKPQRATLVPENRAEVTTEGGLDIASNYEQLEKVINELHKNDIEVSLFVDPNKEIIELCSKLKVEWIELHTGTFANVYAMLNSRLKNTHHSIKELDLDKSTLKNKLKASIKEIKEASKYAKKNNLKVAAGHGLNYQNVTLISKIKEVSELNIGQSIIARSVYIGLKESILEMKALIK